MYNPFLVIIFNSLFVFLSTVIAAPVPRTGGLKLK
ncbi:MULTISPECIES: hypothetical protein [Chryseobacterium]